MENGPRHLENGYEVGTVAGVVGKDKVVKRLSLGNSELAEGFRQWRVGIWFKHSLWLQRGGWIRRGEAGSRYVSGKARV